MWPQAALALCSPPEVQHDLHKGPYVAYAREMAPTSRQRAQFAHLTVTLKKRLRYYGDYRNALRDGYKPEIGPKPLTAVTAGSLVRFWGAKGFLTSLNPDRLSFLYYRRTAHTFALAGGGYVLAALAGPLLPPELNRSLPISLVHWHTLQDACRAPGWPAYYATFQVRGDALDWTWPGADKYDSAGNRRPHE